VALEELQDLKGVWSELSKVWEQIDQMKEQPWVSVQPRKVYLTEIDVCECIHILIVCPFINILTLPGSFAL
jgi:hypothetical protein